MQRLRILLGILIAMAGQTAPAAAADRSAVTVLTNDDFRYGTYIIDRPGVYRLGEDISFNPNSPATLNAALASGALPAHVAAALALPDPIDAWHAGAPLPAQFVPGGVHRFTPGGPLDRRYDPESFGLGFFAAIVIKADGVVLDLAGHRIEQSAEHALLQRFFAVIELADRPFIPAQGPADFGTGITPANNVVIRNGTIGRSAHHGVHGNGNSNVRISRVRFVDYEVAAVALNGVQGLVMRDVTGTNRKDVPVLGTFSSARFIKPYLEQLSRSGSSTALMVRGTRLDAGTVLAALRDAVNSVHHDVVAAPGARASRATIDPDTHPDAHALFHNRHGVVDGNSYSFLINPLGVAVDGFPLRQGLEQPARNVWFSNVHVTDQKAFINEIVALNREGKAVVDPVGAVFQTLNLHPETGLPITVSSRVPALAEYRGNVLANAQALVAKAFLHGDFDGSALDFTRLSIDEEVLKWVEAQPGFETLDRIAPDASGFFCNGDSMFHVNKGVIAFKMDGARNVLLRNTSARRIENLGDPGSDLCGDYGDSRSHPRATLPGYGGAGTRAYTFAGSRNVLLADSSAAGLAARAGSVVGVDILTDTRRVLLREVHIADIRAGLSGPVTYAGPDAVPAAIGFQVGKQAREVLMISSCATRLLAFGATRIISDPGGQALVRRVCR